MSNHNSSFGLSLASATATVGGGWRRRRLMAAAALACEKLLQSSCRPVRPLLRSLKPRIFIFSLSSCCTNFFLAYLLSLLLLLLLLLEDNSQKSLCSI